jgi:DNA-binding beta-propeller fold protein YncE
VLAFWSCILLALASAAPALADSTANVIVTIAGNGGSGYNGDGILAVSASLYLPAEIVMMPNGEHCFSDSYNHRIRCVDASGTIRTIAGIGTPGFSGDGGLAVAAALEYPSSIAVDAVGNLYISDNGNHRIRRIDGATKVISTVVGTGERRSAPDGLPATSSPIRDVYGLAVDDRETLYFNEGSDGWIRRVDAVTGVVTTLAGRFPARPESGYDYESPSNLHLHGRQLFVGSLWRVRVIDLDTGSIEVVAGNGRYGAEGDGGSATDASLRYLAGLAFDDVAGLCISDTSYRIRCVDPTTHKIQTIAGTGEQWFNGDGLAATATNLNGGGLVFDAQRRLIFTDFYNNRVRRIDPAVPPADVPEAPVAVLLPASAMLLGSMIVRIRKGRGSATAA